MTYCYCDAEKRKKGKKKPCDTEMRRRQTLKELPPGFKVKYDQGEALKVEKEADERERR
ncbi:hypothetical protein ACB092_02G125200 [Castanea dentata]